MQVSKGPLVFLVLPPLDQVLDLLSLLHEPRHIVVDVGVVPLHDGFADVLVQSVHVCSFLLEWEDSHSYIHNSRLDQNSLFSRYADVKHGFDEHSNRCYFFITELFF